MGPSPSQLVGSILRPLPNSQDAISLFTHVFWIRPSTGDHPCITGNALPSGRCCFFRTPGRHTTSIDHTTYGNRSINFNLITHTYIQSSRKHHPKKQRAKQNSTSHSSMKKTTKQRVGRPNRTCLPLKSQWHRRNRQHHRHHPYLLFAPAREAALAIAENNIKYERDLRDFKSLLNLLGK